MADASRRRVSEPTVRKSDASHSAKSRTPLTSISSRLLSWVLRTLVLSMYRLANALALNKGSFLIHL
jgi:hypothetical protein